MQGWLRNDRRSWRSSRSVLGLAVREPRRQVETLALCAGPSPTIATGTHSSRLNMKTV